VAVASSPVRSQVSNFLGDIRAIESLSFWERSIAYAITATASAWAVLSPHSCLNNHAAKAAGGTKLQTQFIPFELCFSTAKSQRALAASIERCLFKLFKSIFLAIFLLAYKPEILA
jgi:hypothetical protein